MLLLASVGSVATVFGPPVAVVLLIEYELRYGRVADFQTTLSALSGTILVLSQNVDGVDEEAVAESLPERVVTTHNFIANGDGRVQDDDLDALIEQVEQYIEAQEETSDTNTEENT